MIVKFDGKDIKESRDLPRLVASMAVGKKVDVVVVRKGKELTKTVTLGRLEDGEKQMAKAEERDRARRGRIDLGQGARHGARRRSATKRARPSS